MIEFKKNIKSISKVIFSIIGYLTHKSKILHGETSIGLANAWCDWYSFRLEVGLENLYHPWIHWIWFFNKELSKKPITNVIIRRKIFDKILFHVEDLENLTLGKSFLFCDFWWWRIFMDIFLKKDEYSL